MMPQPYPIFCSASRGNYSVTIVFFHIKQTVNVGEGSLCALARGVDPVCGGKEERRATEGGLDFAYCHVT